MGLCVFGLSSDDLLLSDIHGDVGGGHSIPRLLLRLSPAQHCQQQSTAEGSDTGGHTEW